MTIYANQIEKYLSYTFTDLSVTASDEQKIIKVLKGDPNMDLTLNALSVKGMLGNLFDRIDESNHRSVLVQVLAAELTKSSYPRISNLLSKYPKMKILFERCFDLHVSLKPFGVVPSASVLPVKRLVSMNPSNPFTGSGATGVSPNKHSINFANKARLALDSKGIVSNPSLTASYQ